MLPPTSLALAGTLMAVYGWMFPVGHVLCVVAGVWQFRVVTRHALSKRKRQSASSDSDRPAEIASSRSTRP